MEEFQQSQQSFEPSANNVDVAAPQTDTQAQEPSANNSDVANQNPVQDADTNARYADMRRKQELDQYRSQAETYQQQLDRTARIAGYQSHDELIAALDQLEQEQQQQQQEALYQQAGVDPEAFNQILANHPAIQYANQLQQQQQEQQQLANEWGELVNLFPDITPEKIPPEVFNLQEQMAQQNKHLSLVDAYLRVNYKSLGQQKEQEAIQKLQQNQLTSPGALGSGDVSHVTNVSKLSSNDFNNLVNQVLRGERRQL
jgi:hypothetical protein